MSGFEEREDEFEKRFAMDETLRFKTLARRNKLVGLWVAQLLGRAGAEADAYAAGLVASQVGAADPEEALFKAVEAALVEGRRRNVGEPHSPQDDGDDGRGARGNHGGQISRLRRAARDRRTPRPPPHRPRA